MRLSLHARMMNYESSGSNKLLIRTPVIVKVDGHQFGALTAGLSKPYDRGVINAMAHATKTMVENGPAKFGYTYSDKAFFLLIDYEGEETNTLAGGDSQAIASIIASSFARDFIEGLPLETEYDDMMYGASFSARAFNVPREEVTNYFIYRQNGAEAKLIYALGRMHVSQEMKGVRPQEMEALLKEMGHSKYDCEDIDWKGAYVDEDECELRVASRFSSNRALIDKYLSGD